MKKFLFAFFGMFLFYASPAWAQDAEMADLMRSDGKIYVVVGIILIVLAGLISYLFILDRKISRLEDEIGKKSS
jgi:vacuolar-type H+-ATPase subunit I/STV1